METGYYCVAADAVSVSVTLSSSRDECCVHTAVQPVALLAASVHSASRQAPVSHSSADRPTDGQHIVAWRPWLIAVSRSTLIVNGHLTRLTA